MIQGIECEEKVVQLLALWTVKPTDMIVVEYHGDGDPAFGGAADDWLLSSDKKTLVPKTHRGELAIFTDIWEAHASAKSITNRRPGSLLGVVPTWAR